MKEYLKMADVFEGKVKAKHMDDEAINELNHGEDCGKNWTIEDSRHWIATSYEHAGYAAHAINSHDELVAEVERLRRQLAYSFMAGWEEGINEMEYDEAERLSIEIAAQFARN